jgi:hypothetical protein
LNNVKTGRLLLKMPVGNFVGPLTILRNETLLSTRKIRSYFDDFQQPASERAVTTIPTAAAAITPGAIQPTMYRQRAEARRGGQNGHVVGRVFRES